MGEGRKNGAVKQTQPFGGHMELVMLALQSSSYWIKSESVVYTVEKKKECSSVKPVCLCWSMTARRGIRIMLTDVLRQRSTWHMDHFLNYLFNSWLLCSSPISPSEVSCLGSCRLLCHVCCIIAWKKWGRMGDSSANLLQANTFSG